MVSSPWAKCLALDLGYLGLQVVEENDENNMSFLFGCCCCCCCCFAPITAFQSSCDTGISSQPKRTNTALRWFRSS